MRLSYAADAMEVAVAVAASLVAFAFALSTLERWLLRGRRHELAWSISLFQFSLAAAALAAGAGVGWSGPVFRAFFLFGAILNVPWLALGTVYLLGDSRRGDRVAAWLAVLSAFAAGVIVTAPFTNPLPGDRLVRGKEVFDVFPRLLAAVGSGLGATVVFAGALWSAVRLVRSAPRLAVANVLIAGGTLILSASGLLNSLLGEMLAFSVTLAIGVCVLFGGFLVATSGPPGARARALAAGQVRRAPAVATSRPAPAEAPRRR